MTEVTEATNDFSVTMPLTKVWRDEAGDMWFEGVASSTSLDKQQERMTQKAIEGMSKQVGVPLLPSHNAGALDDLGTAEECWADNEQFRVAGRLDKHNPEAHRLFEKVMSGKQYGLSVGGRVKKAFWRHDEEARALVRHIDEVELSHVAVCRPEQAANPDTYLAVLAKAAEPVTEEGERPRDDLRREAEIDVLARIGRAAVQAAKALWPFSKSGEKDDEVAVEDQAVEEEVSKVKELREQVEAVLTDVGDALSELHKDADGSKMPTAVHGEPQSLPGQEKHVCKDGDYWKGVL